MHFSNTKAFAEKLDAEDVLRHYRQEFIIPPFNDKEAIYFLGNSLGLQPKKTAGYITKVLNDWSARGVESFFYGDEPWLDYHQKLLPPLAKVVGALPHELVIMNALTVNLHLMLVSFYQPDSKRNKIICESKAFPSDQYMLETHVKQRGLHPDDVIIEVKPREKETLIRDEDILATIETHADEVALVLWGGVNYYTGQCFNMQAIAEAAHKAGAKVGFDLAHAAGNVPLQLHNWNVDFACWCSYKYLNAGPGAIGGVFINEKHHYNNKLQRYAGWWGYKKETRFLMQKGFEPAPSAEGWQLSTPSPLQYASHKAALELFESAGIENIYSKSKNQSQFLFNLLQDISNRLNNPFVILTPEDEQKRGSQVSILMDTKGKEVFNYLTENGVYADWREPNVIRVAPVPLYNSFTEIWSFANLLEEAIKAFQQH